MAIQSGTHLGPYQILSAIGAGGMGEVYRAHDPKLGRDVAIKVLPQAFARDADRMARFQREAKVLASLDHPNIASIYGLEDSGGTRALVMQLVEGPTLADRIKAGPIPVDETVHIAKQIADALEYAHERGIIHRDLKPANVKVTNDDAVKVLDFGLAKALEGDPSSLDISTSPTISRMATQAGVLLGTAAYMSPEQAKAKSVDRRADIWAFGCVLYEMLTGKVAFPGESVTDTLAGVIRAEPDWSQLPSNTPMRVRVLLQRCLQKDPKQRLRDIGDARISLDEVLSGAPELALAGRAEAPAAPLWRRALPWAIAGLFVFATALFAFLYFHQRPSLAKTVSFEIPIPEAIGNSAGFAISPDGAKFAFIAGGADGQNRVWVRSLDNVEARPLDGTEGAHDYPIWSPDSRFIAFAAQGKLKKIESTGGPAITLCDAPSVVPAGSWNRDDQIVLGSLHGLVQVAASGGSASPLTRDEIDGWPSFLPDGQHFVYYHPIGSDAGVYVGSVGMKPGTQSPKKLLADHSRAVYVPSSDPVVGQLLFVRGASVVGSSGNLMAQPFDSRRLELTGDAVSIAEPVPNVNFSASETSALVYLKAAQNLTAGGIMGRIEGQLAWFDREGKVLRTFGDPGFYGTLALSPDDQRVAFERADPQTPGGTDNIWLYEFARGVTTRLTFDSAGDVGPVWSPDGSSIVFASTRGGQFDLYEKKSNLAGEDELLYKSAEHKIPSSWSPDGRFLLYYNPLPPNDLWSLSLGSGTGRRPTLVERSQFDEAEARFSPDGRLIAYSSDESGKNEIYVRPFDTSAAMEASGANGTPVSGKWMVSNGGGTSSLWRRDGKELFYLSLDGRAMAVEVNTTGAFRAAIPKPLFKVPTGVVYWDVSADGRRFVMAVPSTMNTATQSKLTVVLNWQAALKK
jgi:eukaryotic-like serine/threonine-protein kinase